MQVLWSRATQARSSCRCSTCLHYATTIARRTTTAASKRRLRISDVFTACYSTILATATFADARVKEDRKKEWDRLIEEVKKPSKLEHSARRDRDEEPGSDFNDWEAQAPQGSTIEAAESLTSSYKHARDHNLTMTYTPLLEEKIDPWNLPRRRPVPHIGEKLRGLDWKLRNTTAERIFARDVDSGYQPGLDQEGQWIDEWFDPDLYNREPKTPLHIEKYESMVMNLVNKILQESKIFSNCVRSGGTSALRIQQEMSKMVKRIRALNIGISRVPTFNYDDSVAIETQRNKLHQAIWALCFAASRGHISMDVAIAKICYNMLVLTVPPSITTYNLLLNEFLNLKRLDLAQIVVDSFLYESRFKPNKRTIRLLLDHYRAKSDFEGFRNIIQRMRGTDGNMRIHMRQLWFLKERAVKTWALRNEVIHRSGHLRQKAPRSRPIYNSLILGSLEFGKVRAAVRYARAALREGHGISAETLCDVIYRVVGRLDAYAGSSLLKALLSQWEDGSIPSISVYSGAMRKKISQLLLLCGINPSSIRSSDHLASRVPPATLSNLLKCMRFGTVTDAVERSANFLLQLDATLGMSGLDFAYAKIKPHSAAEDTMSQRLDWALQISHKHSKSEEKRRLAKVQSAREGRRMRLQVLDNRVTGCSERILSHRSEVIEMQVTAKTLELQFLLREKTPMDRGTVKKVVLALTTKDARQSLFDGRHDQDPISYIESFLFDRTKFSWHRKLMLELSTTKDLKRCKKLTMLRVTFISKMLDEYLDRVARGNIEVTRDPQTERETKALGDNAEQTNRPRRKKPIVVQISRNEKILDTVDRHVKKPTVPHGYAGLVDVVDGTAMEEKPVSALQAGLEESTSPLPSLAATFFLPNQLPKKISAAL